MRSVQYRYGAERIFQLPERPFTWHTTTNRTILDIHACLQRLANITAIQSPINLVYTIGKRLKIAAPECNSNSFSVRFQILG